MKNAPVPYQERQLVVFPNPSATPPSKQKRIRMRIAFAVLVLLGFQPVHSNAAGRQPLALERTVALDTDCDGRLDDEHAEHAAFEAGKTARRGQCVIARIEFVNAGLGSLEGVTIRDAATGPARYVAGSASLAQAPSAFRLAGLSTPAALEKGELVWEFDGPLEPGQSAAVTFTVRLD